MKVSNGKTIRWCQVDVGVEHGGVRGIVCGAGNFFEGDKVVVISGSPPGIIGSTNDLRVHRVGDAIHGAAPAYEK